MAVLSPSSVFGALMSNWLSGGRGALCDEGERERERVSEWNQTRLCATGRRNGESANTGKEERKTNLCLLLPVTEAMAGQRATRILGESGADVRACVTGPAEVWRFHDDVVRVCGRRVSKVRR